MRARDLFESLRADVLEMVKLEREIERIETQAGPHGRSSSSIGGSPNPDKLRGIDRLVDIGLREELEKLRAKVNPDIEAATDVLYGRSGRGGLAKARSSVDADILCAYYLQGMSWPQVATLLSGFSSSKPSAWARTRAARALEAIDRLGADRLANS